MTKAILCLIVCFGFATAASCFEIHRTQPTPVTALAVNPALEGLGPDLRELIAFPVSNPLFLKEIVIMRKIHVVSVFAWLSLLGLGLATTARAGVPEDLAVFKAAATELKAKMASITNEATARANVAALEAAINKYNQAGTTLDASLSLLDRTKEADAKTYESTATEMQTASQSLADEQIRLLSAPPITSVVAPKLNTLRK
jgi:hypothetical protein